MSQSPWPRVAALKTADAFRTHLEHSSIRLGFDETVHSGPQSPLGQSIDVDGVRVGNRFCILPMEGWDGTPDGRPSDLTTRRWRNFGISGAKLIWGGEAVAVCPEGRANPNQLVINTSTLRSLAALRLELERAHAESFGPQATDDLYVGLQLTHSGRFARPVGKHTPEPLTAYHHPVLDSRVTGGRVLTDDDIDRIVVEFVRAARQAYEIGFRFVDVKHCHGYLAHELLSARHRPGKYGGSLENRTRLMREVIDGIRAEVPGLGVAVRLSAFDVVPFRKDPLGRGIPEPVVQSYDHAFGLLSDAEDMDAALGESRDVLRMLQERHVKWICITAGSPYYCPHVQRPALFPPNDGYEPPEDPLRGVARQIDATARLKAAFPDLVFVGSAYTYLQEWLPNVGQFNVRNGLTDFVGLGRIVLSYPALPADVLSGASLQRKSICRTFSDCTTGPRLGLVSGCYPLDGFYTSHPDAIRLRELKAGVRT